ncbi:MAG: diguanylate cyclase [Bdellovibrionota bacterium]
MLDFSNRTLKIAIVESNCYQARRLQNLIKSSSYLGPLEVLSASSGNEACYLFDSAHPDLFIINAKITGIPSRDVCRWIRANESERHTGIIFISGNLNDNDVDRLSVECLNQGADDFVRENCSPEELLARINTVLRLKFMTDELRRANYKLRMMTLTDELTEMANMRCFKKHYQTSMIKCLKGDVGLSVIMLDLDNFKSVNDNKNHLVGSHVISEVGKLIRDCSVLGHEDLAARYGGDEFIVCSEVPEMEYAIHKALELREKIESATFEFDGFKVSVTCSVGVSWAKPGFKGPENDLIKLADLMLYRSKRAGRNCVSSMELRYPIDFDSISNTSRLSNYMLDNREIGEIEVS